VNGLFGEIAERFNNFEKADYKKAEPVSKKATASTTASQRESGIHHISFANNHQVRDSDPEVSKSLPQRIDSNVSSTIQLADYEKSDPGPRYEHNADNAFRPRKGSYTEEGQQ